MKLTNEIIEAIINQPIRNLSGMSNKDQLSTIATIIRLSVGQRVSNKDLAKATRKLRLGDVQNLSDEALEELIRFRNKHLIAEYTEHTDK